MVVGAGHEFAMSDWRGGFDMTGGSRIWPIGCEPGTEVFGRAGRLAILSDNVELMQPGTPNHSHPNSSCFMLINDARPARSGNMLTGWILRLNSLLRRSRRSEEGKTILRTDFFEPSESISLRLS